MSEDSVIGKIICAAALGAALAWIASSVLGGLLVNSVATDGQIFWTRNIAGLGGAVIGGWLGWANSQLIITGAVYTMAANFISELFFR